MVGHVNLFLFGFVMILRLCLRMCRSDNSSTGTGKGTVWMGKTKEMIGSAMKNCAMLPKKNMDIQQASREMENTPGQQAPRHGV